MYRSNDHYTKSAQQQSLRARSYFKLQEIDNKYHLFKQQQRILDLGAAPGSWIEYLLHATKNDIYIVAVDMQEIVPFKTNKVILLQRDVHTLCLEALPYSAYDGVISDMMVKTTGIHTVDAEASLQLVSRAATLAKEGLLSGGIFIAKCLEGDGKHSLISFLKKSFIDICYYRPKATRKQSKEFYIVAKKK